ncbi:hypothetical protein Pmani_035305 [Petrolisthes manimaculis]|uniref:Uncharacterized protein n=1 Tax=Petrolisthes manimaculis TaxID=1843537 RepID=A0AAE1TNK3_9EUCA|nr:hypothetical protein Pmani_035305 [Petrolisthes manimaculis]
MRQESLIVSVWRCGGDTVPSEARPAQELPPPSLRFTTGGSDGDARSVGGRGRGEGGREGGRRLGKGARRQGGVEGGWGRDRNLDGGKEVRRLQLQWKARDDGTLEHKSDEIRWDEIRCRYAGIEVGLDKVEDVGTVEQKSDEVGWKMWVMWKRDEMSRMEER